MTDRSPAPPWALDTLIAAERAFSALSVRNGMQEAFLTFLADDGIVFRPAPVNGKRMWSARANPAATLIWAPSFAEISGAGDLGVSSGPFELRPAGGGAPAIGHGHFVSVWRRSADGEWLVAADMGIGHGRPARGVGEVEVAAGPVHAKPRPEPREFGGALFGGGLFSSGSGFGVGFATGPGYVPRADRQMAHAIHEMMSAERSLTFVTRGKGVETAYPRHAAADVRVYRNGAEPALGVTEGLARIGAGPRRVELVPYGDGMAASRDLGFSYGLLVRRADAAARPDTASYLHVWRKDDAGRWKLALDVENEYPKPE